MTMEHSCEGADEAPLLSKGCRISGAGVAGGILEWIAMVGLVGVGDAAVDAAASAVPIALSDAKMRPLLAG